MPMELLSNQTGAASSYDEMRANTDTSLATVSAAGVTNSPDQTNSNGRGVHLFVNITTLTGTAPTLTVTLQGKDVITGNYYTILGSAALASTGFSRLTVYPGIVAVANSIANDIVPRTWRVTCVTGGTITTIAATVSVSVIL